MRHIIRHPLCYNSDSLQFRISEFYVLIYRTSVYELKFGVDIFLVILMKNEFLKQIRFLDFLQLVVVTDLEFC